MPNVGKPLEQVDSSLFPFATPTPQHGIYHGAHTLISKISPVLMTLYSMDLVDDPSSSSLSAVFEIPGVKLNGLSLQINDGNLVVRGERRPPYNITHPRQAVAPNTSIDSAGNTSAAGISQNDNQSPRFPVQELYFGDFYRTIPLPVGIKVIIHLLTRPLFSCAIIYE